MADQHSIAITGLSCRFPGDGDNLDNFWHSISSGQSAWSRIPKERFNVDAFSSSSKNRNTSLTKGAHFLKQDVSKFDANFFSLPKSEVQAMDPQQRIMTEVVYEALENSGFPVGELSGSQTGVFMGHFTSDYKEMIYRDPDNAPAYSITGACKTSLANRISWLWDLRGPSFTMDTACSSSLVAFHLACQSLRTGESDIAIVGGGNLLLNPEMFLFLSNQAFLAPDGKCKSFDESANGYGRGEGFGCVILKRADDAIAAGDPIRAVVRGTGSNQDGHTKGLTLPSAEAQAALITETYRRAGLDFKDTGYVEAHGTGTQAGDGEETAALAATIAASHSPDNKLIIGSVKPNIGHLEAAAGIAGVIKAVLSLEHGFIPPTINFSKPNPKIKFDEWNLEVPTKLIPWPTQGLRRVSVNSFGYGGTNAHAILDDAHHYLMSRNTIGNHYTMTTAGNDRVETRSDESGGTGRSRLFVLSAQDKDGLKRLQTPLAEYVDAMATDNTIDTESLMTRLAYTLSAKRSRLQWKTYQVASSLEELSASLNNNESTTLIAQSSRSPRLGFVFTGQGAQWARMGVELMAYPVFKDRVMQADKYLSEECECAWSAAEELQKGKSTSNLHLAEYSQTLCTVLQVALVDLLCTWNIMPKAVAGHSSGEIAAAYAMGAISKEDAWKIAYWRGKLSSEMKHNATDLDGSMMAAGLSREKAEEWISKVTDGEVVVACVNSPTSVTISGDSAGIDQLQDMLREEGVFARKLQVDQAYHSPHMQLIAQDYYEVLADVTTLEPSGHCTMHSSVTGTLIEASQLGAVNWVKNLTSPVQFSSAIYDMLRPMNHDKRAEENAVDLLVEIGPHSALQGPSTQTLKAHGIVNIPYQSVISRNQNAVETALNLAGALFAQGLPVDIAQANNDNPKQLCKPLVDLPSYPWKHSQRYWHESRIEKEYLSRQKPKLSLIGAPSPSMGEKDRHWRGFVRLSEEPWIADHKIQGAILYPAAGYIAMALEAAHQTSDTNREVAAFRLRDIQLTSAAMITDESDLECIVQLRPHYSGTRDSSSTWTEFVVTTSPDGKTLTKNCSGLIIIEYEDTEGPAAKAERQLEIQSIKTQYTKVKETCKIPLDSTEFYNDLTSMGLEYGPAFANVTKIHSGNEQSVCTVEIPDVKAVMLDGCDRPHIIHPGTLDAIFHLAFAAVTDGPANMSSAMVPKFIDEVKISMKIPFEAGNLLPGFATSAKQGFKELKSDIIMMDANEDFPTVEIQGFLCTEVASGSSSYGSESASKSITSKLTWRPAIEFLSVTEQREILHNAEGYEKVGELLRLHHHSNPTVSILEIAPVSYETGNTALLSRISNLDSIFETASITIACQDDATRSTLQEVFKSSQNVQIEVVNVSQGNSEEIFKAQSFDFIIASELGVEISELDTTIERITKLVKSDGQLSVLSNEDVVGRLKSFLHNQNMTTIIFDNVDINQPHQASLLVAKNWESSEVKDVHKAIQFEEVTIIETATPSKTAQRTASDLSAALATAGYQVNKFHWGSNVSHLRGKSCISLVELEQPLLRDLSARDFDSLKQVVLGTSKLLWVTGFEDPSAAMIDGLARVVRNETPGLSFRTFHAQEADLSRTEKLGGLINQVFGSASIDDEYRIIDGILHTSRIEVDTVFNEQINELLPGTQKKLKNIPLDQAQHALKLRVQSPGMLDSLCLEYDELPETDLEEDFIEIQVKATALNFREVMVAMGQIPDSKLGLDAAGIVHRVGSKVTKFKVGDKVAMYGHGSHRTYHRSRAEYCALIPDGMSFEQAATIPTVQGTAWNALVRLAKVQKGQSILIHAAAGGVGQSAIQIASHFEMEIFATVSSEAKRKLVREEYGVPDDHIFNSRDLSFAKGIKRMTNGRGVDVVLNSLSGEALRQTWHCIAPFGYFVEIGLRDILANTELDMRPFMQDATFSFFNLTHIEKSRPDIMGAIIEGAFDFLRRGITRPIAPLVTYSISDMENAFRLMQTGKHIGKIALTWNDDAVVPVIQNHSKSPKLDPNAVYMLAGGLGGLGRSLSYKLANLGARKLCFLSRSGAKSAQAKELIHDLEAQNIQVKAYECDIADEKSVATVVEKCGSELGQVRGVFQCAMVLRDTLFMNMTHQQWTESTRSKVQGTWNLHQYLRDVDFFINLSSFAAIFGNRGQSNYGAAGAYEDALAYHRRSLGYRATTLDLGIMRDIGVLAETGITESLREWEKPYGIRENEFLALVDRVIAGDMSGSTSPQILTGLATGGSAVAAGIKKPFYLEDARFSIMANTGLGDHDESATDSDGISTQVLVSQATSLQEAAGYVVDALTMHISKMLQTTPSEIDTSRFLHSYGIDSLVAIEIVNWALKELKSGITVFDVLAGIPMTALSSKIAGKSGVLPKELVPL